MNLEHNLKMVATIDLPRVNENLINSILAWHDTNKKKLGNPGAVALDYPWIASSVRDYKENLSNSCEVEGSIPGLSWNKDFVDDFPEFVTILNSLPFDEIKRVYFLETVKPCPSHVDSSKFLYEDIRMEPCSYRITFRNSNSSPGFYVQPKPRKEWGNERAIVKGDEEYKVTNGIKPYYWNPTVGTWWVLNNYCCQHGSFWEEGDNKVILSIQGKPNMQQHLDLLEKSKDMECMYHPYHKHLTKFYSLV